MTNLAFQQIPVEIHREARIALHEVMNEQEALFLKCLETSDTPEGDRHYQKFLAYCSNAVLRVAAEYFAPDAPQSTRSGRL